MTVQTAVLIETLPLELRFVTFTTSTSTSFAKMSDFPEIKSKHSLVAKYVTEPLWEKLGKLETKTSQFTLSKAIACAVQFDNQHCGIYAGDWDSYKDFSDVFDPLIQEYHGISAGVLDVSGDTVVFLDERIEHFRKVLIRIPIPSINATMLIVELNCASDSFAEGELGGLGLHLAQLLPQGLHHVLGDERFLGLDLRESVGHLVKESRD